jgi:hypothetical protein
MLCELVAKMLVFMPPPTEVLVMTLALPAILLGSIILVESCCGGLCVNVDPEHGVELGAKPVRTLV